MIRPALGWARGCRECALAVSTWSLVESDSAGLRCERESLGRDDPCVDVRGLCSQRSSRASDAAHALLRQTDPASYRMRCVGCRVELCLVEASRNRRHQGGGGSRAPASRARSIGMWTGLGGDMDLSLSGCSDVPNSSRFGPSAGDLAVGRQVADPEAAATGLRRKRMQPFPVTRPGRAITTSDGDVFTAACAPIGGGMSCLRPPTGFVLPSQRPSSDSVSLSDWVMYWPARASPRGGGLEALYKWAVSSAARAFASHARGHRFESCTAHH